MRARASSPRASPRAIDEQGVGALGLGLDQRVAGLEQPAGEVLDDGGQPVLAAGAQQRLDLGAGQPLGLGGLLPRQLHARQLAAELPRPGRAGELGERRAIAAAASSSRPARRNAIPLIQPKNARSSAGFDPSRTGVEAATAGSNRDSWIAATIASGRAGAIGATASRGRIEA